MLTPLYTDQPNLVRLSNVTGGTPTVTATLLAADGTAVDGSVTDVAMPAQDDGSFEGTIDVTDLELTVLARYKVQITGKIAGDVAGVWNIPCFATEREED